MARGIKFNWDGTAPDRDTGLGWTTSRPPLNETPEQTAQRIADGHETPEEANLRIRRANYQSNPDIFENPDRHSPVRTVQLRGRQAQTGPVTPPPPTPMETAEANTARAREAFEASVNSFKESAGAFGEAAQREYQVQWGPDGQPTVMVRANGADEWQVDGSQNWESTWGQLQGAYDRVNNAPANAQQWAQQQGVQSPADILNAQRQAMAGQDPLSDTITDADDYAAKRMGFNTAQEMQDWIADARGGTVGTQIGPDGRPMEREGLTEAERGLYQQDMHSSTQLMLAEHDRAIDAISGETGSTARAFAASDQARQQIGDYRIQQQLGMMQADLQRKQTNFAAQQANLQQMVGQGVVTQAQYIDWVHTDRAMTMQEWSSQMSQTLGAYEQDRNAVNEYVANSLAIINSDLGMRTASMPAWIRPTSARCGRTWRTSKPL